MLDVVLVDGKWHKKMEVASSTKMFKVLLKPKVFSFLNASYVLRSKTFCVTESPSPLYLREPDFDPALGRLIATGAHAVNQVL